MNIKMNPRVKQFLEEYSELLQNEDFRMLFLRAYEYPLDHYETINLVQCLNSVDVDTESVRSDLLYDLISEQLADIATKRATTQNRSVWNIMFNHCNNLMGFSFIETVEFMINNEFNFGIHLTPRNSPYSMSDYVIDFL